MEAIGGALLIMGMRICDVTIGTMRTILVVQGKKYFAGLAGMIEVFIWILAMQYISRHFDQMINLFGYAIGFGLGNILGITLEQKIGLGFAELNIISKVAQNKIIEALRKEKHGVTVLPAYGVSGDISIALVIVSRKNQRKIINLVESIDPNAFITVQHSLPYRGFIHGGRK